MKPKTIKNSLAISVYYLSDPHCDLSDRDTVAYATGALFEANGDEGYINVQIFQALMRIFIIIVTPYKKY